MSKQLTCQKYIYKINSKRLRNAEWNLTLPIQEAKKNQELIALADSQVLRWIDEINGVVDADLQAVEIRRQLREIKREPNSLQNRKQTKELYEELDRLQFQPDYMCLIIDKIKDYNRACRGFRINGVRYRRLLGTNGGIKNSTIVFVSDKVWPELKRRIENGRDKKKALVPAKFEAYQALTCSASSPVSMPHGVIVVPDCETSFDSDVIYLDDNCEGEPMMETRSHVGITIDASDGYGMMLPELAERWSSELELGYTAGAMNTRFAWEKGIVCSFDFRDFAEKVAHSWYVTDAWGVARDVRDAELILTTSMVKLWDSYGSCEEYVEKSIQNGYTFGISKTCPEKLENERTTNYQFLQGLLLSPDDIDELVAPTVQEFKDILALDWRKAILFLCGVGLTEKSVRNMESHYTKAMMIDHSVFHDTYVLNSIYELIRNRIDEAKTGVIKVHGNYSIVTGDPYALCQSIFGLEVTGLLGAGSIYNRYWADSGAEYLACFRAPMSCSNNIRRVLSDNSDEARYWYRYLNASTVFNAWDTAMMALNGLDFDGDIVMLTDNPVIVRKLPDEPALMCVQRKADKQVISEPLLVRSNIDSFGSDIGQTTNRITSMYEVRSHYEEGSEEYRVLDYRIRSGQLFQQNAIDKAKGIIAKPMPKTWYDWRAASDLEDPEQRQFYRSILAEKKPYFMRYIYPLLRKEYNTYTKNADKSCLREFGMTVDEMKEIPYKDLTQRQAEFLRYYDSGLPVGTGDCVMNRICRIFEREFDGFVSRYEPEVPFDYTVLKHGYDYPKSMYYKIKGIFEAYVKKVRKYKVQCVYERVEQYDRLEALDRMQEEFMQECLCVCSNEDLLSDILVDVFYSRGAANGFMMVICGDAVIRNLLAKNGNRISFPAPDPDGDIEFGGMWFSVKTITLGEEETDEHCSE